MATNEAAVVRDITRAIAAEWPDAWTFKVVGNPRQQTGVPDLLVCVGGHLIGLEVKHRKPGESVQHARARASALQLAQIEKIRAAGGAAAIVLNAAEAVEVIRQTLAAVGDGG